MQQNQYYLFARKYILDRCERRKRLEELSSCQLLNVKNKAYLFLPTYPLRSFRLFRFLLQPRFCLCNMPFLIFYPLSRDKTQACFHSLLENLMRSQRETLYHYQNWIEHQYLFRFELIPLDSSLLDKHRMEYLS